MVDWWVGGFGGTLCRCLWARGVCVSLLRLLSPGVWMLVCLCVCVGVCWIRPCCLLHPAFGRGCVVLWCSGAVLCSALFCCDLFFFYPDSDFGFSCPASSCSLLSAVYTYPTDVCSRRVRSFYQPAVPAYARVHSFTQQPISLSQHHLLTRSLSTRSEIVTQASLTPCPTSTSHTCDIDIDVDAGFLERIPRLNLSSLHQPKIHLVQGKPLIITTSQHALLHQHFGAGHPRSQPSIGCLYRSPTHRLA